jgi:hypothetical protein
VQAEEKKLMAVSRASRDAEVLEGEWECMDCGYIEEGVSNRRPKRCVECNAPGSVFEFFEYEEEDWDLDEETDDFDEFDDEYDDVDDFDDEDDDRPVRSGR